MSHTEVKYERYEGIKSYEDPRIAVLVPAIIASIKSAFGNPGFDEGDIRDHIGGHVVILGLDQASGETQVVSYSSMVFGSPGDILGSGFSIRETGCYFVAGTVAKDYQRRGLYNELNKKRVLIAQARGARLIFTRTQNPIVEAGLRKAMGSVGLKYELERVLQRDVYGRQLTGQKPVHRDEDIQAVYDKLNYEAGDAYVLLFTIRD